MKMYIVSVRDSAADAFMNPFCAPSTGMAVRSFRDECNRKESGNLMNAHPEDFELYQVGLWDQLTGEIEAQSHTLLVRGKDCVENGK